MTVTERFALLVLDAQTWAADPMLPLILASIPAAGIVLLGVARAVRGAVRHNGRKA